ncbi:MULTISPECIES: AbrB/MazE/SpoVT family DNA-binding domain-containing protein [unclassified Stygiolobus]|uniref:AbrB/MazE/SpoVT family DNA-binding domain-containing protein n=1 Tax=unclassified Stygiolobus TaxID=2824672 RepID=UPI00307F4B24
MVLPSTLALGLYDITSKFTSRVTSMARVLGKSKLWGKGYTTVPVSVRRLLDISEGSEIEWILNDNNEIVVKKV